MVHTWTISITKKVNKQFQIESILGAEKRHIQIMKGLNDLPYNTIKIKSYLLQSSPSPTSWKFSVVANCDFEVDTSCLKSTTVQNWDLRKEILSENGAWCQKTITATQNKRFSFNYLAHQKRNLTTLILMPGLFHSEQCSLEFSFSYNNCQDCPQCPDHCNSLRIPLSQFCIPNC